MTYGSLGIPVAADARLAKCHRSANPVYKCSTQTKISISIGTFYVREIRPLNVRSTSEYLG